MRKIITVFAGRENNLNVLTKYLKQAINFKLIDEVHFWNYTRNDNDDNYLKRITNVHRTKSINDDYNRIHLPIYNGGFYFNVKAANDIHVKISNGIDDYEIVLGGWNNTRSIIRKDTKELCVLDKVGIADKYNYIEIIVIIINNVLNVIKNKIVLMQLKLENYSINSVHVKTGFGSEGIFRYDHIENPQFYLMDVDNKSTWYDYYMFYNKIEYYEDIIIKCDDDIVFMDLNKLNDYINYVNKSNYDIYYANIINNSVCGYYQQQMNLIPNDLIKLEYPDNNINGSLWESPDKAYKLHNYFIDNYNKFINNNFDNLDKVIKINTRFSINFFAMKGYNWSKFSSMDKMSNDEYFISVYLVENKLIKPVIYLDFFVSHLSFNNQLEKGLDIKNLLVKYNDLYYTLHSNNNHENIKNNDKNYLINSLSKCINIIENNKEILSDDIKKIIENLYKSIS